MTSYEDIRELDGEFEVVNFHVHDPVEHAVTVELYRPDARNAFSPQLRSEFKRGIEELGDVDDLRVLILTGSEASSAFAAGADVTKLKDRNGREQREASKRPRVYDHVYEFEMPVIARINGHAVGGGCELAMASDVRIARTSLKIGLPEINLGIMPGGGGTQRLPRLVGMGQAMKLTLSGELVDSKEAAEMGLVDEVHEGDAFDERIEELAGNIASKSPIALEHIKAAIQASAEMSLQNGIDHEGELFAQLFDTEDKTEGIEAFLENREPEWSGR